MGDKGGNKSKGKTPKTPKHGFRPHEQRQQEADGTAVDVAARRTADRKVPKM
jgi:hypothetical protein